MTKTTGRIGFCGAAALMLLAMPAQADQDVCLGQLRDAGASAIRCDISFETNEGSAKDLQRVTGGTVLAAECSVKVDIDRTALFGAFETTGSSNYTVKAQKGSCFLATTEGPWQPEFEVAPTVEIEDGRAVDLAPNLSITKNVARVVASPIENWVNNDQKLRENAVKEINKFLDGLDAEE